MYILHPESYRSAFYRTREAQTTTTTTTTFLPSRHLDMLEHRTNPPGRDAPNYDDGVRLISSNATHTSRLILKHPSAGGLMHNIFVYQEPQPTDPPNRETWFATYRRAVGRMYV